MIKHGLRVTKHRWRRQDTENGAGDWTRATNRRSRWLNTGDELAKQVVEHGWRTGEAGDVSWRDEKVKKNWLLNRVTKQVRNTSDDKLTKQVRKEKHDKTWTMRGWRVDRKMAAPAWLTSGLLRCCGVETSTSVTAYCVWLTRRLTALLWCRNQYQCCGLLRRCTAYGGRWKCHLPNKKIIPY